MLSANVAVKSANDNVFAPQTARRETSRAIQQSFRTDHGAAIQNVYRSYRH